MEEKLHLLFLIVLKQSRKKVDTKLCFDQFLEVNLKNFEKNKTNLLGLLIPGLYRHSGSSSLVKQLKNEFQSGR